MAPVGGGGGGKEVEICCCEVVGTGPFLPLLESRHHLRTFARGGV